MVPSNINNINTHGGGKGVIETWMVLRRPGGSGMVKKSKQNGSELETKSKRNKTMEALFRARWRPALSGHDEAFLPDGKPRRRARR